MALYCLNEILPEEKELAEPPSNLSNQSNNISLKDTHFVSNRRNKNLRRRIDQRKLEALAKTGVYPVYFHRPYAPENRALYFYCQNRTCYRRCTKFQEFKDHLKNDHRIGLTQEPNFQFYCKSCESFIEDPCSHSLPCISNLKLFQMSVLKNIRSDPIQCDTDLSYMPTEIEHDEYIAGIQHLRYAKAMQQLGNEFLDFLENQKNNVQQK